VVRHMLRLVVSTTRVAIFRRRSRRVANSAVANSRALGMASRTASINTVTQHSPQRNNTTSWPNPVWRDGHWLERLRTWRLLQLMTLP
jgi:hypothetical protein